MCVRRVPTPWIRVRAQALNNNALLNTCYLYTAATATATPLNKSPTVISRFQAGVLELPSP